MSPSLDLDALYQCGGGVLRLARVGLSGGVGYLSPCVTLVSNQSVTYLLVSGSGRPVAGEASPPLSLASFPDLSPISLLFRHSIEWLTFLRVEDTWGGWIATAILVSLTPPLIA